MDPELFPRSGSVRFVQDPAKNEITDNKSLILIFRPVNSGLCVL